MEYITLIISAETLTTIGAALQEMPFKVASPAIQEIDKQVKKFVAEKQNAGCTGSNSTPGGTDGA